MTFSLLESLAIPLPKVESVPQKAEMAPLTPERQAVLDMNRKGLDAMKPVELMGELKNPEVQKTMRLVCDSFGCTMEQLTALIQRESGGNPKARSESGSRGFMQLTGSVFQDMYRVATKREDGTIAYRGRGIGEYIDNFQAIDEDLLANIRPKHPAFTGVVEDIQELGTKDQRQFSTLTRKLQTLTYKSSALGEVEPNLIMGALYLDSINDRSGNFLDNPKNKKHVADIISKLRAVDLVGINQMLTSKGFAPIPDMKTLRSTVEGIIANKDKFQTLITNYNYNGDASRDPDGSEHRIKYGLVVSLSEDQLKKRNNLSSAQV